MIDENKSSLPEIAPGADLERMEVDVDLTGATNYEPFDAIELKFIALYRIAERETFRDPENPYWSTRLREAQAKVVEHVQRHGPITGLDEGSRWELDLFVCVLEKEGMKASYSVVSSAPLGSVSDGVYL